MEPPEKQSHFYIFIILIILVGISVIILRGYLGDNDTKQEAPIVQEDLSQKAMKEILKSDPADTSHISNIAYIQKALEKYFQERNEYPKDLEELRPFYVKVVPQQSSKESYLYAYYPENNPTKYHLGAQLGGNNPADVEEFKKDADFNSINDFVNGFDGTDPIFDFMGGK